MGIITNLRAKKETHTKMKLGFVLFAAARGAQSCHEKSEKRLTRMETTFGEWADTYATENRAIKLKKRINNIAGKMLSHYTTFNEELCPADARSAIEDDDLSYDDCVGGLKVLKSLRNWSRANNRQKKFDRVSDKLTKLSDKLKTKVCSAHAEEFFGYK